MFCEQAKHGLLKSTGETELEKNETGTAYAQTHIITEMLLKKRHARTGVSSFPEQRKISFQELKNFCTVRDFYYPVLINFFSVQEDGTPSPL